MSNYTREERLQRMSMLMESSEEVIKGYGEAMIEDLHEALEAVKDPSDFRYIQGQIAGIREFITFLK